MRRGVEYFLGVPSLEHTQKCVNLLARRGGEYFRRIEEPMGLGRLRHPRLGALPFGRAPRRAVLRLVEHLRSSGRAGSASRSRHQPAVAVARHRRTGAPCASDHHQNRQHACPRGSRRQGASRRRPVLLRGLAKNAEQLTNLQRWREILARAFRVFLNSRPLRLPPRLALC